MPTQCVPPTGGVTGHALGGRPQGRVQRGAHSCLLCAPTGRGWGGNPGVQPWGWATVPTDQGGLALGHGCDFGQLDLSPKKLLTQARKAVPVAIHLGLWHFAWFRLSPVSPYISVFTLSLLPPSSVSSISLFMINSLIPILSVAAHSAPYSVSWGLPRPAALAPPTHP